MRKDKSKEKIADKIYKSMNILRKRNVFQKKEIVIFGCTMWIKNLLDFMSKWNITVSAIVDNNPEKAGSTCQGIQVYLPSEYLNEQKGNICILICSGYWFEMSKQLDGMGYQNNIDYFVIDFNVEKKKSLMRSYLDIQKGYKQYKKLIKTLPGQNTYVFICPWAASGDIYMAGLFLQQFIEKENIDDYVFLVIGKLAYKVAKMFNINNVQIITEEEKINLIDAWAFYGSEKMRVKPLLYWGWRLKHHLNPDANMDVTFLEVMKYDVFNLKKTDKPQVPNLDESDYVDQFFTDNCLTKGKTVIIAPYAGSYNSNVTVAFWEKLVQCLTDKGYSVCTNSGGEHEPVIKGSIGVFFPLGEAVSILNNAGYFIAVRSGLCDIVSSSGCNQIILYERGLNAVNYNYFSLRKMGLSNEAIELIYDKESEQDIFEEIMKNY